MNFKTAIYCQILEPMYMRVYKYSEELDKIRRISLKTKHVYKQDIIEILADIIAIKEKYGIDYNEDLELLEKYKK